jgi:hypothetical protein
MTHYLVNVEMNDVLSDETTGNSSNWSNHNEFNIGIPESFICPLTLEIYRDPLMLRCGKINFERKAIVEWLDRGNDSCPLTRQPLSYSLLVPNAKLRVEVEEWKRKHGYDSNETQKVKNQLFLSNIDTDILIYCIVFYKKIMRGTTAHSEDDINHQRRRRDACSTEFSPTIQRGGYITLLREALNTVRRPSLTGN